MDPTLLASATLVLALLALALVVRLYVDRTGRLQEELDAARARVAALADARAREVAPLAPHYPFDARRFRFVGAPVDGVQFEHDRVLLVAFTAPGREPDARVRDLVREGRVEWLEVPLAPPPRADETSS